MKKLLILMPMVLVFSANGQILKAMAEKAKAKVAAKLEQKVDEKVDRALEKNGSAKGDDSKNNAAVHTSASETVGGAPKPQSLKAYSRYDFVPGEKIIYAEDFSQDVIGEFPLKWKTNGSGELMTIDEVDGKWLNFLESTTYTAPFKTTLPENYTIEFDMLIGYKDDQRVPHIKVELLSPLGRVGGDGESAEINAGIQLRLKPNGGMSTSQGPQESNDAVSILTFDGKGKIFFESKDQLHGQFYALNGKPEATHVAMWVQGKRVRVWINQQKAFDLPNALDKGIQPSRLRFNLDGYPGPKSNYQYYISNIKIASAPPDTRSKLITEGKFVTTGILFDVNSDKIKPTSAGVLKEIAGVLNENPDVKVKIIGHTDSDGDDAKNLDLSKRRAASVKTALSKEYGIDGARMDTDGKGEASPVADNKTPEAKAQNRRVEFVKM